MDATSAHNGSDSDGDRSFSADMLDVGELFRLSTMVDRLRDAANVLLNQRSTSVAAATLDQMRDRYRRLRYALGRTLTRQGAVELRRWSPRLGDDASLDQIFDAATALACWVDGLLNTDSFLANRRLQLARMGEVDAAIARKTLPRGLGVDGVDGADGFGRGQYL